MAIPGAVAKQSGDGTLVAVNRTAPVAEQVIQRTIVTSTMAGSWLVSRVTEEWVWASPVAAKLTTGTNAGDGPGPEGTHYLGSVFEWEDGSYHPDIAATFRQVLRREEVPQYDEADAREIRARQFPPARVDARNSDGTLQVVNLVTGCAVRSDRVRGEAVGEVIDLSRTRLGHRGAAGLSTRVTVAPLAVLRLDRQEPRELIPDATQTLRVFGIGLETPGFFVTYALPGDDGLEPVPHPGITVDSIDVLDDSTADVTVTVAADVPEGVGLPVIYGADL